MARASTIMGRRGLKISSASRKTSAHHHNCIASFEELVIGILESKVSLAQDKSGGGALG